MGGVSTVADCGGVTVIHAAGATSVSSLSLAVAEVASRGDQYLEVELSNWECPSGGLPRLRLRNPACLRPTLETRAVAGETALVIDWTTSGPIVGFVDMWAVLVGDSTRPGRTSEPPQSTDDCAKLLAATSTPVVLRPTMDTALRDIATIGWAMQECGFNTLLLGATQKP